MAFAANDLPEVATEADETWQFVAEHPSIQAIKLENTDIIELADALIDYQQDLYFFHFSGHASEQGVVLDENQNLGKYQLSRLLTSSDDHALQWVLLNGCESYGHVGILTAKGVKAVIATNNKVNSKQAAQLARFFYKCFFQKHFTLKKAFESATATLPGFTSQTLITNPGEINEVPPFSADWALYIHSKYQEVLNWTLEDFIQKGVKVEDQEPDTASNFIRVTGNGNTIISGVSGSNLNLHTSGNSPTSPPAPTKPDHVIILAKLDDGDWMDAFELLDQVDWGSFRGSYIQLKNEYVDMPVGVNRAGLRDRLKVFIKMRMK